MDVAALPRLRFQGFTLDRMRRCLWSGAREVSLRPKSFDVLCVLVERHGRLVTKDELFQAVWPNVTVTDDSLFQCVKDIRQALNDTEQEIVKAVPGRGYVFTAPATEVDDAGSNRQAAMAADADQPSIAVLPFANLSGDPSQLYFSDGITQDLCTSLSKFGQLFVIAHHSAARYMGRDVSGEQIGRELGVRYLLRGSVRTDGERVRVTAELVEAQSGAQIWGERYDRELTGVFTVQDDVVQQIVVRLVARIDRSELDRTMRKAPEAWVAYDHYLRGNAFLQRVLADTTGEAVAGARDAFKQSLAADPQFAPAMRGLAATDLAELLNPHIFPSLYPASSVRAWDAPARVVALDHIVQTAQKAVELDPALPEAYATLGFALHWRYGPAVGKKVFARAFELNPNFVEGRYATVLVHGGDAEESIGFMKRTMRLDPFYPPLYTYLLAKSHFFAGEYEEAITLIRTAADRVPGFRPVLPVLCAVSALTGRDDEARAAAARLREVQPDFSIGDFLRFMQMVREEDNARLRTGLRRAGLPE
jgi:TolB-like protein/tetratricopeptide (TPR) repeat protein